MSSQMAQMTTDGSSLGNILFYPLAFQGEGVLLLSVSVRFSIRPSVFELQSPNLHQTGIMGHSWMVLKMVVIDHDLQGHFGYFDLEF